MYIAPDGSRWYTGVRYFHGGKYHRLPPEEQRPRATHSIYQVFSPVDSDGAARLYTLCEGDAQRPDAEEVARRFRRAAWTAREQYDPSERKPW